MVAIDSKHLIYLICNFIFKKNKILSALGFTGILRNLEQTLYVANLITDTNKSVQQSVETN